MWLLQISSSSYKKWERIAYQGSGFFKILPLLVHFFVNSSFLNLKIYMTEGVSASGSLVFTDLEIGTIELFFLVILIYVIFRSLQLLSLRKWLWKGLSF